MRSGFCRASTAWTQFQTPPVKLTSRVSFPGDRMFEITNGDVCSVWKSGLQKLCSC